MVYKVLNLFQQIFSPITVQVNVTACSCSGTSHKQDPLYPYEIDVLYFFHIASCEVGNSLKQFNCFTEDNRNPGGARLGTGSGEQLRSVISISRIACGQRFTPGVWAHTCLPEQWTGRDVHCPGSWDVGEKSNFTAVPTVL